MIQMLQKLVCVAVKEEKWSYDVLFVLSKSEIRSVYKLFPHNLFPSSSKLRCYSLRFTRHNVSPVVAYSLFCLEIWWNINLARVKGSSVG